MNILIVESEPSGLVAKNGQSHAQDFGVELQKLHSELTIDVVAPYDQCIDDSLLSRASAVVFPGSGVSWSAHDVEATPLRNVMEKVFQQGLPCFGSCNGMQMAAVLLGGCVETRIPEIGIAREIHLTEEGKTHPMMRGRQPVFSVPTVHSDQVVELPRRAQLLATNAHCPIQSFACRFDGVDFWGVEYHPEISIGNIGRYIEANVQKFASSQDMVGDLLNAEIDSQAATRLGTSIEEMRLEARTVELQNWIGHVEEYVSHRPVTGELNAAQPVAAH